MRELGHELAVITVNHVVILVDGKLLLAKTLVVCCLDMATNQASLGVIFPVGHKGGKAMILRHLLSTFQTGLEMLLTAIGMPCGILLPDVVTEALVEFMVLYLEKSALVAVAKMLMRRNIACSPVRGLMGMPGKDEVAPAASMTAAHRLVIFQGLGLAGDDIGVLQYPLAEIGVAGATNVDMVLAGIGSTVYPIVTAVESASPFIILMLLFLLPISML